MSQLTTITQLISVWGITVPLAIGAARFLRAGIEFRLFTLFLFVGFCTDVSMWLLLQASQTEYLRYILSLYSLVEAMFFFWFVRHHLTSKYLRRTVTILSVVTPFIWLGLIIRLIVNNLSPGPFFDPFYEIGTSFLAGLALLNLVEQHQSVSTSPRFWILLAIFFYCFCTFFLMSLLYSQLSHKIWFMNHVINISTYILYSVGLWKVGGHSRIDSLGEPR